MADVIPLHLTFVPAAYLAASMLAWPKALGVTPLTPPPCESLEQRLAVLSPSAQKITWLDGGQVFVRHRETDGYGLEGEARTLPAIIGPAE